MNMNDVKRIAGWAILAVVAVLSTAEAFPGWIGVYGMRPRHDGANPGQFQVMMNQDYFGLNANVGIRVNGGDWSEQAMAYVTNTDGNSVWSYTPPAPFPFGAEVEYYFHGYEGASNLYDSADSQNYHSGPLFWTAPVDTGLVSSYPGNSYGKVKLCADGRDVIGANAIYNLQMSRKSVGEAWVPLSYPLEDNQIADFGMAADEETLVVACMIGTNLFVRSSRDGGATFSTPVSLAYGQEGVSFSWVGVAAGAPGEFGIAYGLATNCCGAQQIFFTRSTDGGATWTVPVLAMESGDSGSYYSWQELGHNNEGWHLAVRRVYGTTLTMYAGHSADGASWTATKLGDNRAWGNPGLSLSPTIVAIAADPYADDYIRVWRHASGSGWSTQDVGRVYESGRAVHLSNDGQGNWHLFRQVDNTGGGWLWSSYLSRDDAMTWTTNRALLNPPLANASDSFTLEQVLNIGSKQYLLWHADYYVGTYQRRHEAQLQKSDGYEERIDNLVWDGALFTVVMTNLAPGTTNHLEGSDTIVDPVWTNIFTWPGNEPGTNYAGTASTQGWFRIRTEP